MTKVAVLGAGINGLTCAVKIKEKYPNINVVIIAEEFTPHTTGDGSGGFWFPYLSGDTPQELLSKWGVETYRYLHGLWLAGGHDVSLVPAHALHRAPTAGAAHGWAHSVFGYSVFDQKQLEYFSELYTVKYVAGFTFTSFIVHPPTMLALMHARFTALGGSWRRHRVLSLRDPVLDGCDVVVNCLGLGARQVVPDAAVVPIRGQISKVLAPWVTSATMDMDSGNYILPNAHNCVLGGTHQVGDFNRSVVDEDTDFVVNGCTKLMPALKNAKLVSHWVGLRPGRQRVRLEPELVGGKLYIHNYGHGGSGLTLFWGCASDVLQIFDSHMNKEKKDKSKL